MTAAVRLSPGPNRAHRAQGARISISYGGHMICRQSHVAARRRPCRAHRCSRVVVTTVVALMCSGAFAPPVQAATAPSWTKVAEGCADFHTGGVTLKRCYTRYKISSDGNAYYDYYRVKATLTGFADSGRRMKGILLRAVPIHSYMKLKPVNTPGGPSAGLPYKTYKFATGCATRDMSFGFTVPIRSAVLTGTFGSRSTVCTSEWIAPYWNSDAAQDWGSRWSHGGNRPVSAGQTRQISVDVTTSVPQGRAGTWSLLVSGESCADNWQPGC